MTLSPSSFDQNNIESVTSDFEEYSEILPKHFRISSARIALTYTHCTLDKELYKLQFKHLAKRDHYKLLSIAHETGESGDHNHTHVLIDFGSTFTCSSARRFDFNGKHCNIRKIVTSKHWVNWINYMAKEDKDNEELWKTIPLTDKVWCKSTVKEALDANVKTLRDVIPIKAIWDMKPTIGDVEIIQPTKEWQKMVVSQSEKKPDPRKITWLWEKKGNTGKSVLCKYLMASDPQRYYCVNQIGGMYHFATIVQEAMKSNWNGHCMLIDLSRAAEDKQIYEPIECLKNGLVTALKYKGGTSIFNNPHVFVFANFEPDHTKLSKDRWGDGIIHIEKDGGYTIKPVDDGIEVDTGIDTSELLDRCLNYKNNVVKEIEVLKQQAENQAKAHAVELLRYKDERDDEMKTLRQQVEDQAKAHAIELNEVAKDRDDADSNAQRLRSERNEARESSVQLILEIKEAKDEVMRLQAELTALRSRVTGSRASDRLSQMKAPDYQRLLRESRR